MLRPPRRFVGVARDTVHQQREHALRLCRSVGRVFGGERDRADEPKQIVDVRVGADGARLLCAREQRGSALAHRFARRREIGPLVEHRDHHRRREPAARSPACSSWSCSHVVSASSGASDCSNSSAREPAPTRRRRGTPLRAAPGAWGSAGRACRSPPRRDGRSPRARRRGRARRTPPRAAPSRRSELRRASARWRRGAATDDAVSSWVALVVIRNPLANRRIPPYSSGGSIRIAPAHCTAPGAERRPPTLEKGNATRGNPERSAPAHRGHRAAGLRPPQRDPRRDVPRGA